MQVHEAEALMEMTIPNSGNDIAMSVVIPTFNRREVLLTALRALLNQTLRGHCYEILVADDGSSDGTGEAVNALAAIAPLPIIYSWAENCGANAARNRALWQARGRLLVFINDDTIGMPDFLETHLATHELYPDDKVAVLGRVTISPEVPHSVFADLHLDAAFQTFAGRRELDWRAFYTCNISVKADFLRCCGQFEERLRWHEDIELGERLARHGLRVIYEPTALGHHLHHLQEHDYLGVANREGISLAEWYYKDHSLLAVLGSLGFHLAAPTRKKVAYWVADRVFNPQSYPSFVKLAGLLAPNHPELAKMLYRKLFQARKRQAATQRLKQLGAPQ